MGVITKVLGNPDLLKYIVSFQPGHSAKDWLYGDAAIHYNHRGLLDLMKDKMIFSEKSINLCIEQGNLEFLIWLLQKNDPLIYIEPYNYIKAVEYNQLDIIIWLHENSSIQCPIKAIILAMQNDNVEISKWFYNNLTTRVDQYTIDTLCIYYSPQKIKLLNWIHNNTSYSISLDSLKHACFSGNIEILGWILNKLNLNTSHDTQSRIVNNMELLLHNCYVLAIENKHLMVVDFLVKNKIPYHKTALHKCIDTCKNQLYNYEYDYHYAFDEMKAILK